MPRRKPWLKDGFFRSIPWLMIPPGIAGFAAWAIVRWLGSQATAEARIDAVAGLAGVLAGVGIAWSFLQAYRRRDRAGEVSPRRPRLAVVLFGAIGIALGIYAADAASSYRATAHYGPGSSMWVGFVDGCVKNCGQTGRDAGYCNAYCGCSARTFFAAASMRDVDDYFRALSGGGPIGRKMQQKLEEIGKKCAASAQR